MSSASGPRMSQGGRLETITWPVSRLGEAMEALALASGLAVRQVDLPAPPDDMEGRWEELAEWWPAAVARALEMEAEPVETTYGEAADFLRGAAPALLQLKINGQLRLLPVLRGGKRRVTVITADAGRQRLRVDEIRAALCEPLEAPLLAEVDGLLEEASISGRRRELARSSILHQRLSAVRLQGGWLLRPAADAPIWRHVRQARLGRYLVLFAAAHFLQYLLWLASWYLVGKGALSGTLDPAWLLGWVLLLMTLVPLRMLVVWAQGRFSVGAGTLLKQQLLYGALRVDPDGIRDQGVGQLLGRVIEAEAVETLALNGGLLGVTALIELALVLPVLAAGAGRGLHVTLLLAWLALTAGIAWRYYRGRGRWTEARLAMTHDLVERMVGHRTRLAQERRDRWHEGEDQTLAHYLDLSGMMDRAACTLMAVVSRGWLVVGLLGIGPAFVVGNRSTAELAVAVGGVISAYQALRKLARGLLQLLGATIAWQQVAPLFRAAGQAEVQGAPLPVGSYGPTATADEPVLQARELIYRYRTRPQPVLRGCDLEIRPGERLLIEGVSGSGKSTLASLLAGLRQPDAGLLLVRGLDWPTLGAEGWRRLVAAAPQFHENHVLTETFAFNLLMSRRWPPRREDVEEALTICRELGLGELLQRMPAGMLQMVGETGWQLSHGERSRLYVARALLQGAQLVVLDESFAALDAANLQRTLRCVRKRAPALLVIVHP